MNRYQIENTETGVILGVYEGETADQAFDAMNASIGYPTREYLAEVLQKDVEDLLDDIEITEID